MDVSTVSSYFKATPTWALKGYAPFKLHWPKSTNASQTHFSHCYMKDSIFNLPHFHSENSIRRLVFGFPLSARRASGVDGGRGRVGLVAQSLNEFLAHFVFRYFSFIFL